MMVMFSTILYVVNIASSCVIKLHKKYVLLFLRENHPVEESVGANSSLTGCSKVQEQQLKEILQAYKGLFQEIKELPPNREVEHEIRLFTNSMLRNISLYKNSIIDASEVKKQLQKLLEQGVIRPFTSPCGSPIIIMPKTYGNWQMCIDYMVLNKITLKNRYPLPRIDYLLHQLQQEKYFTKLDLMSRYHQVRVKEEDTQKTSFKIRQGLYE